MAFNTESNGKTYVAELGFRLQQNVDFNKTNKEKLKTIVKTSYQTILSQYSYNNQTWFGKLILNNNYRLALGVIEIRPTELYPSWESNKKDYWRDLANKTWFDKKSESEIFPIIHIFKKCF